MKPAWVVCIRATHWTGLSAQPHHITPFPYPENQLTPKATTTDRSCLPGIILLTHLDMAGQMVGWSDGQMVSWPAAATLA